MVINVDWIKNSKAAHTLLKNFMSLMLIKVFNLVMPLLILPYMTNTVGVGNYGLIAFAAAIMVFFETITDWGFNYTATRDVAEVRDNKMQVSQIFSEVFIGRILLMFLCFVILYILSIHITDLRNNRLLILFTFLYIPGNILCQEWIFQAYEQMKFLTITNIISKGVILSLVFVVIQNASDYVYYPLLIGCGYIVSGIIAQILIYKKLKICFVRCGIKQICLRIRNSTNMFLSLILPNLYTNFTTVLLKSVGGNVATGIYAGGNQLQSIIDNITLILSRTFFPFLVRHREKHHIYVLISGTIAIVASLVMFIGADYFVSLLLASSLKDAAEVMRIMSPAPVFLFLMNTYGTNYLVIVGKERDLRNIIIVCSLIGFVLTWIFTTKYSYIGAAITVTTARGIRGLLTYYFAKKSKKTNAC